jgi:S-adenosylmethionine decarboxylase
MNPHHEETLCRAPLRLLDDREPDDRPVPLREAVPAFDPQDGGGLPGRHLILEMYGATGLDDAKTIEAAFRAAIRTAGATLLHLHLHVFTPTGGVTGTASLAESHMSIHTWPEYGYAALDIFMCGQCDPRSCLPDLLEAFAPERVDVQQVLRGLGVPARAKRV